MNRDMFRTEHDPAMVSAFQRDAMNRECNRMFAPTKAEEAKKERDDAAWRFEHGDHMPDGTVRYGGKPLANSRAYTPYNAGTMPAKAKGLLPPFAKADPLVTIDPDTLRDLGMEIGQVSRFTVARSPLPYDSNPNRGQPASWGQPTQGLQADSCWMDEVRKLDVTAIDRLNQDWTRKALEQERARVNKDWMERVQRAQYDEYRELQRREAMEYERIKAIMATAKVEGKVTCKPPESVIKACSEWTPDKAMKNWKPV